MLRSIIVALSENNVIGRDKGLPWKLSADLKRLKELTMGHHIIMGRKTWESLGKPLPGRIHIVITRQKDYKAPGASVVNSLEEALIMSSGDHEVFIFGGGEIFAKALPVVQKIYLTRVHAKIQGDTYFPKIDLLDWKIVFIEDHHKDEKNDYDYSFITMERIKVKN